MSPDERDHMDDEELIREYLEGDSPVSRLYRRHADAQPGSELDARIRAAAHRAVARGHRRAHSPFAGHWMVPASLAAVLVLSVSVVLLVPEPEIAPSMAPESRAPASAGKAEQQPRGALEEDAGERAGAGRLDSRDDAEDRAAYERALERLREREAAPPAEPAQAPGFAPLPEFAPAAVEKKSSTTQSAPAREPLTGASSGASERLLDESLRDDAQAWLSYIKQLANTGKEQQALVHLRAFRARYPDHPLPSDLAPLARILESERP